MLGRFDVARTLYMNSHQTLDELGRPLLLANLRLDGPRPAPRSEMPAAERELRAGLETLEAMGEASLMPSLAALAGQALLAQGHLEEAETQAARSEELSEAGDFFSQVEWRALRASVYARTGRVAKPNDRERSGRIDG